MRSVVTLLIGLVCGYVISEVISAGFAYYGIDIGHSIIGLFNPSYNADRNPRQLADDVYIMTHRSPVPVPNRDLTTGLYPVEGNTCVAFLGMGGEQGLRNLYVLRYKSLGIEPPKIENATCVETKIGSRTKGSETIPIKALIVRTIDGPTCRMKLCATDVWLFDEAKLILSMRVHTIGLALTSTNGFRDIVADGYYLFTWDGEKYVPRYF